MVQCFSKTREDASHWTQRGAYFGYQEIMNAIDKNSSSEIEILQESNYDIKTEDIGSTYFTALHFPDYEDTFTIKDPQAKILDKSILGKWG